VSRKIKRGLNIINWGIRGRNVRKEVDHLENVGINMGIILKQK
jgi:hypothetical protein